MFLVFKTLSGSADRELTAPRFFSTEYTIFFLSEIKTGSVRFKQMWDIFLSKVTFSTSRYEFIKEE